ncbi:hypothetical protein [Planosporangium mesophilum]|uniref:Uncharacterized protein n=1 Tax=Planosporangium mesophilum TaxID=689768 RepID=A0A8J3TM48_9ACTN|nr:hypothetical protein [Planosporangium mesophilum]NJC84542.1 hypothetical protein [Planosporangium mesophilum]GII23850.1 hypothetical protein Pme01_34470 [Planosporangium mesophilum]
MRPQPGGKRDPDHVGPYAGQIDRSGKALGNFPQAFTRPALISAVANLDRALGH